MYACRHCSVCRVRCYREGIAIADRLCCNSAKAQLLVADALLTNDAAAGREIVANYQPAYPSKEAYFAAIDKITLDKDAVIYDDNGNATVDYQNI